MRSVALLLTFGAFFAAGSAEAEEPLAVRSWTSSEPVVCDPKCRNPYWPFFIPVVGPLISLGTMPTMSPRTMNWVAALVAIDAVVQGGGLAMSVMGFVPRLTLVSNATAQVTVGVWGGPGSGVSLQGVF